MELFPPQPISMGTDNSFSALNDDVLCEFFELMSDIDPPRARANEVIGPGEVRFRLGWIYLTHVNRRWRQLLLSLHSLWAKVFSVMPESALDEALSRAGNAPLHITLDHNQYSPRYKKLTALATTAMGRVSVLSNPNTFNWYTSLHDKDLPNLLALDILQKTQPSSNMLLRAPKLQSCKLYNMPTMVIAPHLRRLVVEHSLPSPVHCFLDMLNNLSHLEHLDVILLAKGPITWSGNNCPTVILSRLHNLHLFGTQQSDIIGFWQKLVLPDDMRDLRIAYRGNAGWGPVVDTFAPRLTHESYNALAFLRGQGDLFRLRAFHFDADEPGVLDPGMDHLGVSLEIIPESDGEEESDRDEGDDSDGDPLLQYVLPRVLSNFEGKEGQIEHMSFDCFNEFELFDELEDDPDYQPRVVLRDELCPFSSVISVSGRFTDFDFSVLEVSDDEDDEEDGCVFPKLVKLIGRVDAMNSGPESMQDHWNELNTLFKNRSHAGVPIPRLHFIGYMFPGRRGKEEADAAMAEGLRVARMNGLQEFVDRRETLRAEGGIISMPA
ncbi:unnamed protein product [Peniophora sp. CBMAI 1063]|nr:unnamed protein product [Peniophora sp. CBMAI 1063]